MELTQEQQVIFDAVIASLRTNSKTIEQLTPQTSLGSNDWFEINGGRKVSYKVLSDLIAAISSKDYDTLRILVSKNVLQSVSIDVTEHTATLTIMSRGTTITCDIPVATASTAGIITALDRTKIQAAYALSENVNTLEQRLETVESRSKKDAAVLRFSHTVEVAEYKRTTLTGNYTVVYDTVSKLFLGCRKAMSRIVADAEYFLGAHVEAYNDMTELHAREDMLYLDGQERLYCFDGEGLKCLNGNQAAVVMSQAEYDSMEPQADTIYYITE